jgi:hypothetical protein
VDTALQPVYRKLGVSSRDELREILDGIATAQGPLAVSERRVGDNAP